MTDEIDILRETGCYADMTLPSAPSQAQTRKINSIYYAVDDPDHPKSHDWGEDVGFGAKPDRSLLIIQGPLMLDWRRRKRGILPRVENAGIQNNQPASMKRLDLWMRARIGVPSRPDWIFIKLHTHGAPERNQKALLGPAMLDFHRALQKLSREDKGFHYHYVTAREMYNLCESCRSGLDGSVADAPRPTNLSSKRKRFEVVF